MSEESAWAKVDELQERIDRLRELAHKASTLTITSGNASRAYAALLGDLHAALDGDR